MTTITTIHNRPPHINPDRWNVMLVQFLLDIHRGGLVCFAENTFHCFFPDLPNSRIISVTVYDPALPTSELELVKTEVSQLISDLISSCN